MFLAIPGKIFIPMPVVFGVVGVLAALVLVLALKGKKAPAAVEAPAVETVAQTVEAEAPAASVAPGSAGKLKLYDTPPKTAAMLMAIVADQLKKPINELRFISIKEVI